MRNKTVRVGSIDVESWPDGDVEFTEDNGRFETGFTRYIGRTDAKLLRDFLTQHLLDVSE